MTIVFPVKRRYDDERLSDGDRSGSQLSLNETESSSQNAESVQGADRHGKVLTGWAAALLALRLTNPTSML